jgi:hypothetical protein
MFDDIVNCKGIVPSKLDLFTPAGFVHCAFMLLVVGEQHNDIVVVLDWHEGFCSDKGHGLLLNSEPNIGSRLWHPDC